MERCTKCNKKSWVLHDCKCGDKYCLNHRYPESHNCTYNYKEQARKKLAYQLDKVVVDKIENRI